ncbi:MAG: LLM class F420-dependent oxidoreductase [Pseudomonadota bacterium]
MKFGLMFANVGRFGQPQHCEQLVQSAEDVGVESLWTVEHVVVPKGYESQYPYSKTGKMPGPENSPIPDPVVWLSFVAAISKTLNLATGILILPQRHPAYVAKEFATLDQLSNGRAILGIGIGWMEEEFNSLGVPFNERVGRTEESMEAIRSLWKPEASAFKGKYYSWNELESHPKPVQQPGVPIVIGGHVKGAARRAARYGDGFFPARADNLDELLATIREECSNIGRNPDEVEVTTGPREMTVDAIKELEDKGVSRIILPTPGLDKDSVKKGLEAYGENIISKF